MQIRFVDLLCPRHALKAFLVAADTGGRQRGTDSSAQCAGLARFGDSDGNAQAVGEHLRPVRAARSTAREDCPVEADPGSLQLFYVSPVLEDHTLEQGPQQVPFAMPASQTIKTGPVVRTLSRTHTGNG